MEIYHSSMAKGKEYALPTATGAKLLVVDVPESPTTSSFFIVPGEITERKGLDFIVSPIPKDAVEVREAIRAIIKKKFGSSKPVNFW